MSRPASFGDVTAEYRAARYEKGVLEAPFDLVWFDGPDAVTFLDGLVSQRVTSAAPGSVGRSFLLGPRGKLTALLWVLRGEGRVGLLTDPGFGPVVAETLGRYRIRVKVVISPDERPLWAVIGPDSPGVTGWTEDGALTAGVPLAGNRRVVTTEAPEAPAVGELAWTAVRVEAGEPLMGVDVDERTIPQETGLAAESVDFEKGCFLGQELVARIDSRGHVNRVLRGVQVTTNVLPPPGAELSYQGAAVGALSSPAESLDLRAPIGLALVRRQVEPGSDVTLTWPGGEAPARVLSLPLVETLL